MGLRNNKFLYLCLAELAERGYDVETYQLSDLSLMYSATKNNLSVIITSRKSLLILDNSSKTIHISTKEYRWYDKFMEEIELL